jgi:hypothetical protein
MISQIQRVEKQAVLFTEHRPDDLSHTKSPCVPESASGASTVSWLMKIPIELESSTDFTARVAVLVAREDAIVYVDTSFLMWLTKIGRTSRRQLLDWLVANCPNRVHVPVWSAHEYLRHHVAGTIVTELGQRAKELEYIASKTYEYLRPFLDDPLAPGNINAKTQQVTARDALNEIQHLAMRAKSWNDAHEEHAAQVITFINDHVLGKTQVFDYMSDIEVLSKGRFNGRLPPGFQDRRKKAQAIASTDEEDNSGINVGSNHWGDLIFWKEVLDHARETRAGAIIILTNDRKNDWHLGGRGTRGVDEDLRKLKAHWKPVPCVHPMLNLEAHITAGVSDIVLLDAPYLGALLRNLAGEHVKEFVDVAIVPDPPLTPDEDSRRKVLFEERMKERERKEAEEAEEAGVRFIDSSELVKSHAAFMRALYDSRRQPEAGGPTETLLREMQAVIERGDSIADLLTKERIEPLNNSMLTTLARELHDQALEGTPGHDEALTDLVSTLRELPELTAASLCLGLVASMYLTRTDNQARLPPRSPVAPLLFERQGEIYAAQPIAVLMKKFETLGHWPLYLLDAGRPSVEVSFDIVPNTDEMIINSLRLAGEEVFIRAQSNSDLRLGTLFDGRLQLLGREVVESACQHFSVPFDQVTPTADFDQLFSVDPTAGFKSPHSVYVDKEETA